MKVLRVDESKSETIRNFKQVIEVMQLIFDSPGDRYPTVAELVRCDLFQYVNLREMRGASVPVRVFSTPFFVIFSFSKPRKVKFFLFFPPKGTEARFKYIDIESIECGTSTASGCIESFVQ